MNAHRLKALEGLLDYISGLQGNDLKSALDETLAEKMNPMKDMAAHEAMESPEQEMIEEAALGEEEMEFGKKPKGISVQKVSVMGIPKSKDGMMEDEMEEGMENKEDELAEATDDELEELYKKFSK